MKQVLEGIKVLDISQVAAVPMAARHLADFGADVIHVERPNVGDSWRVFQARASVPGGAGAPSEINYTWENYNRNKRSIALDLSKGDSLEIVVRLVKNSDVFLTNLRPFEKEQYRLEYETLKQINPKLVYGSLTGFGKQGTEKNNPAYDSTAYWARASLGYMLGTPEVPPVVDGGAFGDNVAALALAYGVMLALFAREKTGEGQEVDISLFHTAVYQMSWYIAGALATGMDFADWRAPSREESPNPLSIPYQTGDGRWLLLALVQPDRYWAKICHAIGQPELEHDPRFELFDQRLENHAALFRVLEVAFKSRTLAEWKQRLNGIPFAPYQNFIEVIKDSQARANGFFAPFEHPTYGHMELVTSPVSLGCQPATIRTAAPEIGQHTEEVLLEIGYDWDDIARFKDNGTIG